MRPEEPDTGQTEGPEEPEACQTEGPEEHEESLVLVEVEEPLGPGLDVEVDRESGKSIVRRVRRGGVWLGVDRARLVGWLGRWRLDDRFFVDLAQPPSHLFEDGGSHGR